ncbi:MAG: dockerin type I repeat-containing protein [Oscillospiraceae bacterium]|nr:dockerin type I repeat-containing protein [Oscillospiraceae bacterium]
MKKALSMALALVMALTMFTGLGITAAAAEEVYLKITISDVVKTGDKTYEIYTTYENPEGYYFRQSRIEIYFNPAQIKFTKYASTYFLFDADGISPYYGDLVKGEFLVVNAIHSDYMDCVVASSSYIGLARASGEFLCFGVELLDDDLTAIDFEVVLSDVGLEFGVGGDVVLVPNESVSVVNNGSVKLKLKHDVYLNVTVTDAVQIGGRATVYTTYENPEGYHLIQGEFSIYYDPEQISFRRVGINGYGISNDYFLCENNTITDCLKIVFVNGIGLPDASGDFLAFEIDILQDNLTEIMFRIELEEVGLEVGDNPYYVVMVPSEDIHIINNDNGVIAVDRQLLYPLGHVSGGSKLSVTDARLVLQYIIGRITLTPEQLEVADVDGNGIITIADARLILQKLVGKIDKFPAE